MNNQTVIVHGPQGCGKTRHAAALAKHYGKTQVVEGDDSYRTAPWETDDALVITSDSQQAREWGDRHGATVVSFDDAMKAMGAK